MKARKKKTKENVAEVDLVWADVDASGNITYSV